MLTNGTAEFSFEFLLQDPIGKMLPAEIFEREEKV